MHFVAMIGLPLLEFPLKNVSLVNSKIELVRTLQAEFREGSPTSPKRWGRGGTPECYVDDAYIYRVNQLAAPSPSTPRKPQSKEVAPPVNA